MGRFFHKLKANKTGEFPRNWCFVDTETRELVLDASTHKQVLRLGVACYLRDAIGDRSPREVWWDFTTPAGFWDRLIYESESDRRVISLAYNVGFDVRILDTFKYLVKLSYKPGNLFAKQSVFIADLRRAKHRITILDAMNFFKGKLEQWGELVGVPKIEVDFATVSDKNLLAHCRVDVEILKRIWLLWRGMIHEHDLGCFCPTRSAQALAAFKHRYMDDTIYIHANNRAVHIERESYYGGRTECYRLGRIAGGPFYKVDVNSMYPYIMHGTAVPVKLLRVVGSIRVGQLRKVLKRYAAVAKVTLQTDLPCYPFRVPTGLTFPVGRFTTYLAGPELELALQQKHVKAVHRVSIYQRAVIFKRFVAELYALRLEYGRKGDKVFEEIVKYILNGLYGKWGQRNEVWRCLGHSTAAVDNVYTYLDDKTGRLTTYYVLAGYTYVLTGHREAHHSFHAISSYITSGARVYLWRLILQAGRCNVFYVDTDALIVNQTGYDQLQLALHPTELGRLKIEYTSKRLHIHAPKDYTIGNETHVKGVGRNYERIRTGLYRGWQWQGVRGALRAGRMDCVIMNKRDKYLHRVYRKGQVSASGSVSPFVLDGATAFSRCSASST